MAGAGYWWRPRRAIVKFSMLLLMAVGAAPACARDAAVAIPPTTLDLAIQTLARQSDSEIISTELGLAQTRTIAVSGIMSVHQALEKLLDGTGFRAVALPAGGYRIIRAVKPSKPARRDPRRPPPEPQDLQTEVIVTASKQRVSLLRYPGSVLMLDATTAIPAEGANNLTANAQKLPILQSTQLGAGRDKIFIRGVADSSFNGSTQSTTSTYLDDVQLNYTGPDAGLRLYDIKSVEILEGPQGTLYGSGAIGGVIRLTSNPVDPTTASGSVGAGVSVTAKGAPGFDLAGVVNIPILRDRLGARAVAYRIRDGGYINDLRRHLADVNQSDTVGARLGLRLEGSDGWRGELSGVFQRISTQDAQYAARRAGPIERRSFVAQPFDNQLLFGRFALSKDWESGLKLFAASGVVGYESRDQFDATSTLPRARRQIPLISITAREKLLVSQEIRLSRALNSGASWVVGFSYINDRDILSRSSGAPNSERTMIGVTNVTQALSAFGEGTAYVSPNLALTIGARTTFARVDGEPSSRPSRRNFVKGRSTTRFDPTVALSWVVAPRLAVYARVQTANRTGGLAVARGVGRVADYRSDSIVVGEVGVRKQRIGETGIAFSGAFSIAHWQAIQADLIDRAGEPYTANIGDAEIDTVEGNVDFIPVKGLRIAGSLVYTSNRVYGPIADQSRRQNRRLPEIPPLATHFGLSYQWALGKAVPRLGFTIDTSGRSVLGTGDLLDVSQGNYATLGLASGVRIGSVDVSLVVDNLTNQSVNRFAYGNPFLLSSRNQLTPSRPLNARLGVAVAW